MPIEKPKFKLSFILGPQIAWYNSLLCTYEHWVYNTTTLELYEHTQLYEYFYKQLFGASFTIKSYIKVSPALDFTMNTGFLKYQTDKNFFIGWFGCFDIFRQSCYVLFWHRNIVYISLCTCCK